MEDAGESDWREIRIFGFATTMTDRQDKVGSSRMAEGAFFRRSSSACHLLSPIYYPLSTISYLPRRRSAAKRGFSLIELMVAVSIMMLLAGVATVSYMKFLAKARTARASADVAAIKAALDAYKLDNHAYPTARQGLVALVEKPSAPPAPPHWDGPYLQDGLPLDPWGREYVYFIPGREGQTLEVVSYGADGQPGGEGEDRDVR